MEIAMRPSKGAWAEDGKLLSRLEWPYVPFKPLCYTSFSAYAQMFVYTYILLKPRTISKFGWFLIYKNKTYAWYPILKLFVYYTLSVCIVGTCSDRSGDTRCCIRKAHTQVTGTAAAGKLLSITNQQAIHIYRKGKNHSHRGPIKNQADN